MIIYHVDNVYSTFFSKNFFTEKDRSTIIINKHPFHHCKSHHHHHHEFKVTITMSEWLLLLIYEWKVLIYVWWLCNKWGRRDNHHHHESHHSSSAVSEPLLPPPQVLPASNAFLPGDVFTMMTNMMMVIVFVLKISFKCQVAWCNA